MAEILVFSDIPTLRRVQASGKPRSVTSLSVRLVTFLSVTYTPLLGNIAYGKSAKIEVQPAALIETPR